ncbi:uncharacterized protein KNAG_0L00930 [Huiozyma naganishii CBS 8797]|uniref:NAD(P)-binding domain-containing protein n=1 Tax=Huiozyma naganishii (strain ATCC MYA-139 / BCRC 22969 / CBS 8797 / KCTC 17520 / NBRC 10181 / NCYC 3082 / Yp74L-3) TaxID=1071383 RepID=J7RCW2_HUIN7|nr:hypothetical protein KNAG_0L00930 [Kazachstania naganishii CBS 8797]CCK72715.1 hypothetical protein KNAG_0L00930 [Kazachstania naganishii CBS 8797]
MNVLVIGATGLCGAHFVEYALESTKVAKLYTLSRSDWPTGQDPQGKLVKLIEPDSTLWGRAMRDIPGNLDVLICALGTTRARSNAEEQYAVDHDLTLELATVAKREKHAHTVVVVSSTGAHPESRFFYARMKGDVERDITELQFNHTVLLRPGILLGERYKPHVGYRDFLGTRFGALFYRSRFQAWALYPIRGSEVAKVGLHLALEELPEDQKVQIRESNEILDPAEKI